MRNITFQDIKEVSSHVLKSTTDPLESDISKFNGYKDNDTGKKGDEYIKPEEYSTINLDIEIKDRGSSHSLQSLSQDPPSNVMFWLFYRWAVLLYL
jgi:hypothetical protein